MTKLSSLILILIQCGVTTIFAQRSTQVEEKCASYLKNFRQDFSRSVLAKKPEEIMRYYDENVRLMPEFQKTIKGKSNALIYLKAFVTRFDILEYNRIENEILDLGPIVTELGVLTVKMKMKSTGKEYNLKGKYLNFWKKSDGGTYALITEAWNYDHKLEGEDNFRFKEVPEFDVALRAHLPITNAISFELAALNRLMEATVTQHDAKVWAQFYTDDGMFLYSNNPPYKGQKTLGEFFEDHCKGLPVFEKLDIRNDEIIDLGDYIIEYASHIANWRGGEYSGVGLGKDLRIWRREKNCYLKIFRHIAMYD